MKNSILSRFLALLGLLSALVTVPVQAAVQFEVAGTNPFPSLTSLGRIYAADFNNDGKLDMLTQSGTTSGQGIVLKLGNGDGTFQAAINQPNSSAFTSGPLTGITFTQLYNSPSALLLLVDLNGDGRVDIIDSQGANAVPLVYLNNGSGYTASTSPFPAQQFTGRLVFGDFNNDGLIDALNQAGSTAGTGITLYLNSPGTPGTFTTIAQPTSAAFTSGPFTGMAFVQVQPSRDYFVDLDGDGRQDLVIIRLAAEGTTPLFYRNTGSGFTAVTTPIPANSFLGRIVFGDFTGDGLVDILHQNGNVNGTAITLYVNNGSFSFTAIAQPAAANFTSGPFNGVSFPAVVQSNTLVVADFNGDSLLEVWDSQTTGSRYLTPTASGTTAPTITSSTPANGAASASTTASFVLNFNKTMTAGTGNIRIKKTSDNSTVQTIAANSGSVTGSGTSTITIAHNALTGGTGYYLNFDLNAFTDSNGVGLGVSSDITRVAITSPTFLAFTTGAGAIAPTVTTTTQTSVTHNSATLGGNVTADGGASVTERGIVWGLASNPTTTADTKVANGSGTGVFSGTVNGLPSNTLIHVRAYATNSVNTSYGNDISFTTNPAPVAVVSLTRSNGSPTNASTVNWTLTFASAVTGLTASNFSLTGAAAAGLVVGAPTTSNNISWGISVTTGSTDGTLTLNLANATGLSTAISTTLPFTGDSYTIDKTPPTVLSVTRLTPTGQNTNATTVTFRVTYSEPVALNAPEKNRFQVVPVNGSNIVGTVTGVTGSTNTRDVTVNLTSGTGEFRLRVID